MGTIVVHHCSLVVAVLVSIILIVACEQSQESACNVYADGAGIDRQSSDGIVMYANSLFY